MQDIQLKVTHSAHITKEVSIKLSAASNANDTNQQKFIIESLKHDLNNQRDAVHELKASTQLFLSNIETNHEKTISYKQKIQTILDLVDSLLE